MTTSEDELNVTFEELYLTHFQSVFRVAYLLGRDGAIAEEATQEAFARALARWDRLAGQPWAVGWVSKTATNLVRRWAKGQRAEGEDSRVTEPDVEGRIDLWRAISRLPRRQQQALLLHYVYDLQLTEIGRVMGCRVGTVKAHLARARHTLEGAMEVSDA